MFKIEYERSVYTISVYWPAIYAHHGVSNETNEANEANETNEANEANEWFVFRKFVDHDNCGGNYIDYHTERLIGEFYDDVDSFVDEVEETFLLSHLALDDKTIKTFSVEMERRLIGEEFAQMQVAWVLPISKGKFVVNKNQNKKYKKRQCTG